MIRNSRLVFTTATGRIKKQQQDCKPKGDGTILIRHDSKGRRGRGVTVLSGFAISREQLKKLAKTLKQECCSGGTVRDGVIEIQGDHSSTLNNILLKLGFKTKPIQS